MSEIDTLDYRQMMEDALRGVIRTSMAHAARDGLSGEHHFFISFHTGMEGVQIPATLKRQNPDEMTIVLQYQYSNLQVTDADFAVTLNFNAVPMRLTVPFAAITSFVDPSAAFGLSFTGQENEDGEITVTPAAAPEKSRAPQGKVVPFTPNRPTEAGG